MGIIFIGGDRHLPVCLSCGSRQARRWSHTERLEDGGEDKHHSSPVEQVASARLRRQREGSGLENSSGRIRGKGVILETLTSPPALVQESRSPSSQVVANAKGWCCPMRPGQGEASAWQREQHPQPGAGWQKLTCSLSSIFFREGLQCLWSLWRHSKPGIAQPGVPPSSLPIPPNPPHGGKKPTKTQ